MAMRPWTFSTAPPTFGELYNLARWHEMLGGRGMLNTVAMQACVALLQSRDNTEPKHTVAEILELEFHEIQDVMEKMMDGLKEAGTTVTLLAAFQKMNEGSK